MSEKAKVAREVAGVAVVLGILADLLLRTDPWGLNLFLWAAGVVAALAWLAGRRAPACMADARGLLGIAVLFALAVAWRDSLTLKALDLLVIGVTLSLPALRASVAGIRRSGITDQAAAVAFAGFSGAIGSAYLVGEADWKRAPRGGWQSRTIPVVRGVILALPVLFVFGGLFASADAAFAAVVGEVFDVDFGRVFEHVAIIGFFAWVLGGYFRGILSGARVPTVGEARFGRRSLGAVEVGIVLGLLATLFVSFLAVQIRYHFGGAALVRATTGLTYAEYARAGFFELVVVSALVLPLLLVADWLFRREGPGHERLFRALAGIQLVLLFAVMGSAIQRMRLYQSVYGLTELRFYTMAFMAWLAVVFVWFAASVLRGRRDRFAFGALVAGWVAAAALSAVNPDALIVRVNAARAEGGYDFDAEYALSLSADAVPALVAALPALRPRDRCVVADGLLDQWSAPDEEDDWRSFSVSRWQAARTVRSREADLREIACDRTPEPG